ncbi:MAG TPA: AMP-binding protein, partial [Candidatus Binataceae bacterium]|nr:AMP-binding protein [Candidatus Binataceae bacterium]
MNTVNFVTIPSAIVPDQEILVFGDQRLNFAELAERVGRLSTAFKQFGLGQRDVVAVLDTNSDLYISCYYAAAKAGLTFLPLNYRAKETELEYMINTAGAKVLLAGDRYLDLVAKLQPKLKVEKIVAMGDGKDGMQRIGEIIAKSEPDEGEAEVDEEDTSILMYTSGTTSLPKGVMLSFHDFTAYVTANVEMADGTDRGTALVCVPFYHIAGTTAYMSNVWTGRRLVVMPQFDAKTWLSLVEKERVTHAFVVPTMMKQLIDEPAFAKTNLTSLTNLAYGGAPMPVQVIRRAIEVFPKTVGFVNAYGQT